jgi:hypothetical protein
MRGVIVDDQEETKEEAKKEAFKIELAIDKSNEEDLVDHKILISEHPDEILEIINDYVAELSKEENIEIEPNSKKPYKALIKFNKQDQLPLKLSFNIVKIEG